MNSLPIYTRIGWGVWIALLTLTTPSAVWHCIEQWHSRAFSIFPFLFLLAFVLVYSSWSKIPVAPNRIGWTLTVLAVTAAIVAAMQLLFLLPKVKHVDCGALAFAFNVCGWLASHQSARQYSRSTSPSLFRYSVFFVVWALLPLGFGGAFWQTFQAWTGALSGQILDYLSISTRTNNAQFQLAKQSWDLAPLVGDGFSFVTLVGLGSLWIAWQMRSYVLIPVYLAIAIVWGIVGDTFRLTIFALMHEWYNQDLSTDWRASAIGACGLLVCILLFLSTDRLLLILFQPTDSDKSQGVNPLVRIWNRLFGSMGTKWSHASGNVASKRGARV